MEDNLASRILEIHRRLAQVYGEPQLQPDGDPISQIVNTILSQNTNDGNRDRAFRRLRQAFPTWEEVRRAPVEAIEEAIRPAGLAPQRAPRLKAALEHIYARRGELDLHFLADLPVEEARAWLTQIKGVGPKTASIVLLFSLGKPAFPVDTHVHRVARRLGIVPEKASAERTARILEPLIPPELYYPFHLNLIRHGREICQARRPHCERCVLRDLCAYYCGRQEAG